MAESGRRERDLEEAMDWLLRLQGAEETSVERAQFQAWLAGDPSRVRAWAQAQQAWRLVGEVRRPGVRRAEADRRRSRPLARFGLGAAAAALAACLLLVIVPTLSLRLAADHVTRTAELRQVELEDGTVVRLSPRSALATRYSAAARTVALLAGEAFFEVEPDAARPFVVEAEGLEAKALGTAFNVRIAPRSLAVEVASGVVAVRRRGEASPSDARLGPGDRITVDRTTGDASLDRLPPADVASWRDGKLFVVGATVAEVVEELRRYQPGWIVIADDRLAAERVTGLYDLRDPDRALRALVRPAGGAVHEASPLLHILSLP